MGPFLTESMQTHCTATKIVQRAHRTVSTIPLLVFLSLAALQVRNAIIVCLDNAAIDFLDNVLFHLFRAVFVRLSCVFCALFCVFSCSCFDLVFWNRRSWR